MAVSHHITPAKMCGLVVHVDEAIVQQQFSQVEKPKMLLMLHPIQVFFPGLLMCSMPSGSPQASVL